MKERKLLDHNKLVELVTLQITMFTADPRLIKKRIEDLIDRGFMKRDPD